MPFLSSQIEAQRELPDFTTVADGLGQVAGEEGVLVIEEFHGRLVTAEDVKRLDCYRHQQRTRGGKRVREMGEGVPVKRMLSS